MQRMRVIWMSGAGRGAAAPVLMEVGVVDDVSPLLPDPEAPVDSKEDAGGTAYG
jgi:hypothetical protein